MLPEDLGGQRAVDAGLAPSSEGSAATSSCAEGRKDGMVWYYLRYFRYQWYLPHQTLVSHGYHVLMASVPDDTECAGILFQLAWGSLGTLSSLFI